MASDVAVTVGSIAEVLGGVVVGPATLEISAVRPLETAGPADISFLANPRYAGQLAGTRAACVILAPSMLQQAQALPSAILCDDPYRAFAGLTRWWAARRRLRRVPAGVHPTAVVDPSARIDPSACIGPHAVIGAGAVVEAGVVLGPRVTLEPGAHVGAMSRLAAGCFIGADCAIGQRAVIHAGVVIGADGFGFAPHEGRWEKIEQLGAVRIGDDVEIGANSCIDRGALDDTVIGDGVKLDNLIQIGHNVQVGAHTAMAGCVGVAGSARIGSHCTFGGGAIVLGHLEVADHVHVSAATVVTRSIKRPGQYSGVFPIDDNASWEKNAATLRQLHRLRDRLRALERGGSTPTPGASDVAMPGPSSELTTP
jgi:UDP-3-O-[3-hydroxymyristoyl] glucosamine N-acyltransferase